MVYAKKFFLTVGLYMLVRPFSLVEINFIAKIVAMVSGFTFP